MNILWFTWKDRRHPHAGGAEAVNEELARRLVADGHEVLLVVGGYSGATAEELVAGYRVVRLGNRYTVYYKAWRYYRRHLVGWADLVIDEVNTMPFFAGRYVREPSVELFYMLCRQIWFYQARFPINIVGYLLEPIYLRMLRRKRVITISRSTQRDLGRFGFPPGHVAIIPVGVEMEPVDEIDLDAKFDHPTVLSLGAIRPMKRVLDQIEAFEIAKARMPALRLVVAGDATGAYGARVIARMRRSQFSKDIEYRGRVSTHDKVELLRRSHVLMVTSVKEGWCLVVTEAGSQGTPAVTYDVDGLRDSVDHGVTGFAAGRTPAALAESVVRAFGPEYAAMAGAARTKAMTLTYDASYAQFLAILEAEARR